MDTCPIEVVTLILEFACTDDYGRTARSLGRVSKYFRGIVEPMELRSIAVPGIDQLRGALMKLKRAHTPRAFGGVADPRVAVRHLFISELTSRHAIANDALAGGLRFRETGNPFWTSGEGRRGASANVADSQEFWKLAHDFVITTSNTLRVLSLLSMDNWFSWRGAIGPRMTQPDRGIICPKVLGILSGNNFPSMVSLTINHNAASELKHFGDDGSTFQYPNVPALRRLHISSPIYMYDYAHNALRQRKFHPLLACQLFRTESLEQLIICHDQPCFAQDMMDAVFGTGWHELQAEKKLPGKLQSVVLQQGVVQDWGHAYENVVHRHMADIFVKAVEGLNVAGLKAQFPMQWDPEAGRSEHESLLAKWKEQCLAMYS